MYIMCKKYVEDKGELFQWKSNSVDEFDYSSRFADFIVTINYRI